MGEFPAENHFFGKNVAMTFLRMFKSKSENQRRILGNMTALFILQGINYLFPYLTFPYLARVLTPEKFGSIQFATSVVVYVILFVDYGFNYSATKEIAIHKENKDKIADLSIHVLALKGIFFIFSSILLLVLVYTIPRFSRDPLLYILTFSSVFWNLLFPQWLFQGMEKMRFVTISTLLARAISAFFIFSTVKNSQDYLLVPFYNFIGGIISALLALLYGYFYFRLPLKKIRFSRLKEEFQKGFHLFLSSSAWQLTANSFALVLGFLASDREVAFFLVADKITVLLKRAYGPIFQALFPHLAKIASESRNKIFALLSRYGPWVILISAFITTLVFIFAENIVLLVAGEGYEASIWVLKIIIFKFLISSIGEFYFLQLMIPFSYNKELFLVLASSGIASLVVSFLVIRLLGWTGLPFVVVGFELAIQTIFAFFVLKKNSVYKNFLIGWGKMR